MATMTKAQAMAAAKDDFRRGVFGSRRHTFDVWGGRTAYVATRRGIERVERNDDGGTRGIKRPDVLVVPADQLGN